MSGKKYGQFTREHEIKIVPDGQAHCFIYRYACLAQFHQCASADPSYNNVVNCMATQCPEWTAHAVGVVLISVRDGGCLLCIRVYQDKGGRRAEVSEYLTVERLDGVNWKTYFHGVPPF
jgi:hypothetical protein